ncbi:LysR family transcriptional regulator [Thiotrichales bacterium 19S3-7]|nr:LysR family transcriptional regulator [Thiotrichales bacterium 19S3-7]MCF6801611.1 LysR family transcriptional regulator [Thiotrichales bacterium 19S3-11]
MSDLDRFELFIAVAEAPSLSEASEKLNLSKASLSKQIKKLENELKVDLFSRASYRLTLTSQGEILLQQVLRLKKELDNTRAICNQFHEEPQGQLHIVVFSYFAKKLIFPKLKAFLHKYPKLNLIIDTSERIPNFEKEQVDISIGFSLPVPNSDLIIQRSMGTTNYLLCASEEYFNKFPKPKTLEDLKLHQLICHISRLREPIKFKSGYHINLTPYLLSNSVSAMIDCALNGIGMIQLPTYMIGECVDNKSLISVLEPYQRTHEHIYYHYPKYRYIQPKVQKFIEFFLFSS